MIRSTKVRKCYPLLVETLGIIKKVLYAIHKIHVVIQMSKSFFLLKKVLLVQYSPYYESLHTYSFKHVASKFVFPFQRVRRSAKYNPSLYTAMDFSFRFALNGLRGIGKGFYRDQQTFIYDMSIHNIPHL